MANNNIPDLLYQQSRESLLLLEDTRLYFLLAAVANYYLPRNDQPQWGTMMRAIAQEMARLDYDYQYDIAAKAPQYLTPPDIKREYAAPLQIKSTYPYPTQFDKGDFTGIYNSLDNPVGYRDMLVDLIQAYGLGATTASIADVIYAYTGKKITVVELYKLIGQGVYDQSDRNAVQVSVNVGGNNALTDIQSLTQLQEIVQNLYGAIDLAKPAHVGLEFTTVFAETENVSLNITDTLRIIIRQVEAPPLDPMLWVAPIFNIKHPKTTLAAYGRKLAPTISYETWFNMQPIAPSSSPPVPVPATALPSVWNSTSNYPRGVLVAPSTGSYQMYRALKKNVNQPPATSPTYWKLLPSPAVWQAYYPIASGMYTVGMAPWTALTGFYTGQFIIDPNGNLQIATQGGTSGATVSFNPDTGGITDDGSIVWLNLGANYLVPPSAWIQVVNSTGEPTGEVANWNVNNPMGLVSPRVSNCWEIKNDILNILTES
jgi:hypothetical protein